MIVHFYPKFSLEELARLRDGITDLSLVTDIIHQLSIMLTIYNVIYNENS